MINLERVAYEIKNVGLYDLVLQDVQSIFKKNRVTEDEILKAIDENQELLEDYMQTNVEYNLSNIHIKDIKVDDLKSNCKQKAKSVNENLTKLKELEKYTLDFEQSATLVIIFTIEFFVLFSVQYFIVLLDLKEWQWWIYGVFASTVLFAWLYAKKQSKLYTANKKIYDKTYLQTLQMIDELEEDGCIKKVDLLIDKSEEHI